MHLQMLETKLKECKADCENAGQPEKVLQQANDVARLGNWTLKANRTGEVRPAYSASVLQELNL